MEVEDMRRTSQEVGRGDVCKGRRKRHENDEKEKEERSGHSRTLTTPLCEVGNHHSSSHNRYNLITRPSQNHYQNIM